MKKFLLRMNTKAMAAVALVSGGFVAAPAFAADDISAGVVSAITGAGPQVTAVVLAMVSVIGILVAWSLIRKSIGK